MSPIAHNQTNTYGTQEKLSGDMSDINTYRTQAIGCTEQNCVCFLTFLTFEWLYRYVCTYFNVFLMVVPNNGHEIPQF